MACLPLVLEEFSTRVPSIVIVATLLLALIRDQVYNRMCAGGDQS